MKKKELWMILTAMCCLQITAATPSIVRAEVPAEETVAEAEGEKPAILEESHIQEENKEEYLPTQKAEAHEEEIRQPEEIRPSEKDEKLEEETEGLKEDEKLEEEMGSLSEEKNPEEETGSLSEEKNSEEEAGSLAEEKNPEEEIGSLVESEKTEEKTESPAEDEKLEEKIKHLKENEKPAGETESLKNDEKLESRVENQAEDKNQTERVEDSKEDGNLEEEVERPKKNERTEKTQQPVNTEKKAPKIQFLNFGPETASRWSFAPEIVITELTLGKGKVQVQLMDEHGNLIDTEAEQRREDGLLVYKLKDIERDGKYTLFVRGENESGTVSEEKCAFTVNRCGTTFVARSAKQEAVITKKEFEPAVRMHNLDHIQIVSCMLNGKEVNYTWNGELLVIDRDEVVQGKNTVTVETKDGAGNVSSMEPWEFYLQNSENQEQEESITGEYEREASWLGKMSELFRRLLKTVFMILSV